MPRHDRLPAALYLVVADGAAAPLAERERPAVAPGDLARMAAAIRRDGAEEAVVLFTGGRVECYVVAPGREAALAAVGHGLRAVGGRDVLADGPDRVVHQGAAAAQHLLRVACGLEAVPNGEPRALTEVGAAFEAAQAGRSVGPLLHRIFEGALRAGRRARADTGIATKPAVAVSAAFAFLRGGVPPGSRVERVIADELDRIDDWRLRREVFATVMA